MKKLVKIVLDILKDEIRGDVKSALKKLHPKYTMTWVYKSPRQKTLFPHTNTQKIKEELEEVYHIKGRRYVIKNIASGKNLVIVEMVESYPDLKSGEIYRTPMVIVWEFENGKIKTGRHYCDPKLSYLHLKPSQLKRIYK